MRKFEAAAVRWPRRGRPLSPSLHQPKPIASYTAIGIGFEFKSHPCIWPHIGRLYRRYRSFPLTPTSPPRPQPRSLHPSPGATEATAMRASRPRSRLKRQKPMKHMHSGRVSRMLVFTAQRPCPPRYSGGGHPPASVWFKVHFHCKTLRGGVMKGLGPWPWPLGMTRISSGALALPLPVSHMCLMFPQICASSELANL